MAHARQVRFVMALYSIALVLRLIVMVSLLYVCRPDDLGCRRIRDVVGSRVGVRLAVRQQSVRQHGCREMESSLSLLVVAVGNVACYF